MSLLSLYRREIITDIYENHADISEVGRFKVVAVNQEDYAGPHRDAVYQR